MSLAAGLGLVACGGRHGAPNDGEGKGSGRGTHTLTIKGSDTMVILAQRWAERFMKVHPDATVQVSGGGTGTGIAALMNGTTDIATASRPIKEKEQRQLEAVGKSHAAESKVAVDALAVYVQAGNPVRSLRVPQLKKIFRGQLTRWTEVGGPNVTFVLYSRENNSGTYAYFKEHVLDNEDFAAEAQTLPGTAAVINAVSRDKGGIGYGGIAYASGVRAVGVANEEGKVVPPTKDNALSGRYPLSRFLYLYTVGEPRGMTREFIAWVQSPEGQALVETTGFYPLKVGER